MTYVIAQPCVDVKDKACIEECPVDCIYEGHGPCTSTRTNASTAEPVSRSARSRRSSTRTTPRRSGRTTTRRTSSSSTSSARPAAPPSSGLIERDHPFIAALPPQNAVTHGPQPAPPRSRTACAAVRDRGVPARTRAVPRAVAYRRRESEPTVSAVSARLPVFPWDQLEPYKATAAAHPDGIVDLSVGTPVDPVPELIQQALTAAADCPGLPDRVGHARAARRAHRLGRAPARRRRASPTGTCCRSSAPRSWSPGCRPSWASARATRSAYPRLAYPTYEVGARLAGAEPRRLRRPDRAGPGRA